MLRATPCISMVLQVALAALPERDGSGIGGLEGGALCPPVGDGVDTVEPQLARLSRPFARLGQRERVDWADAHVPQPPVGYVTEYPLFRSALSNPQVEGAAIGVHPWLLGAVHLERRQPVQRSSHRPLPSPCHKSCPYSQCRHCQTGADASRL